MFYIYVYSICFTDSIHGYYIINMSTCTVFSGAHTCEHNDTAQPPELLLTRLSDFWRLYGMRSVRCSDSM